MKIYFVHISVKNYWIVGINVKKNVQKIVQQLKIVIAVQDIFLVVKNRQKFKLNVHTKFWCNAMKYPENMNKTSQNIANKNVA